MYNEQDCGLSHCRGLKWMLKTGWLGSRKRHRTQMIFIIDHQTCYSWSQLFPWAAVKSDHETRDPCVGTYSQGMPLAAGHFAMQVFYEVGQQHLEQASMTDNKDISCDRRYHVGIIKAAVSAGRYRRNGRQAVIEHGRQGNVRAGLIRWHTFTRPVQHISGPRLGCVRVCMPSYRRLVAESRYVYLPPALAGTATIDIHTRTSLVGRIRDAHIVDTVR